MHESRKGRDALLRVRKKNKRKEPGPYQSDSEMVHSSVGMRSCASVLVAATESGPSVDRFTAYRSPFVAVGAHGAHGAHGVRNSSRSSRPARDELL